MVTRYKVVTPFRKSCFTRNSIYELSYEKDTIVEALPNTLGIMCFDTLENAKRFSRFSQRILRVMPIGKGTRPKKVAAICNAKIDLRAFYNKNFLICETAPPPQGTICYRAVKVLD